MVHPQPQTSQRSYSTRTYSPTSDDVSNACRRSVHTRTSVVSTPCRSSRVVRTSRSVCASEFSMIRRYAYNTSQNWTVKV